MLDALVVLVTLFVIVAASAATVHLSNRLHRWVQSRRRRES